MQRHEISTRAAEVYADELRYALAREPEVDTEATRERATLRFAREMEGEENHYFLCRGWIEAVHNRVERSVVVDVDGQLSVDGAIRVGDNILVPVAKAKVWDWTRFDQIREDKFQQHAEKRSRERQVIQEIIERLHSHGGNPTTFEACPEMFGEERAA